nr:MAG: hypothetical protein DIU72_12320 [Pseudomonadota bacterium]
MQITIKLLKGELTVPALHIEGGLALHRDTAKPGYWSVSHVDSGLSVWDRCARSKADAMVRFDALLSLTDWTRPRHELIEEEGLFDKLRALQENPPSAPRKAREPRPPLRVAKRTTWKGEEFEVPVWWEAGGLTVEGNPREGLTITHEPSGLRVVTLPRGASRAKAVRLAKTFLALGEEHGMDWTQKNPFPPTGAPQEIRRLVRNAEQGIL